MNFYAYIAYICNEILFVLYQSPFRKPNQPNCDTWIDTHRDPIIMFDIFQKIGYSWDGLLLVPTQGQLQSLWPNLPNDKHLKYIWGLGQRERERERQRKGEGGSSQVPNFEYKIGHKLGHHRTHLSTHYLNFCRQICYYE